jgi:predicted dehydrogenase
VHSEVGIDSAGERAIIKIAVVGAGIRGSLFARSLGRAGGQIVAIADRAESAAQRLAAEVGAAAYADHRSLLHTHGDLDALVVATPDHLHREVACDAAAAGVNLLVEKPLATSVDDATAIVEAVRAAGVRCGVAFENRWNPRFIHTHELAQSGALGQITSQCSHLNDTIYVPTTMLSWAARSTPGWFLMPHTVDLSLWISGKTVRSVYASGARGVLDAMGVETLDGIDAIVKFTDGTALSLHSHWVLNESFPSVVDFRYELVGTGSSVFINGSDQGHYLTGAEGFQFVRSGDYTAAGTVRGPATDLADSFLRYLRGDEETFPSMSDGLRVTRIVAAIHESAASGAVVAVDDQ